MRVCEIWILKLNWRGLWMWNSFIRLAPRLLHEARFSDEASGLPYVRERLITVGV